MPQDILQISLKTLVQADFQVQKVEIEEEFSVLTHIKVYVKTQEVQVPPSQLLGQNVTLTIRYGEQDKIFSGVVTQLSQEKFPLHSHAEKPFFSYVFQIQPSLWQLSQTTDCRIFQGLSSLEILDLLLKEHSLPLAQSSLFKDQPFKRDFCVQYNESQFNFISRLLEEEGIFYAFDYQEDSQVLKLSNNNEGAVTGDLGSQTLSSILDPLQPHTLQSLKIQNQTAPKSFSVGDFNEQSPSLRLISKVERILEGQGELWEYPGDFKTLERGERMARLRLEEKEGCGETLHGTSTVLEFSPGRVFSLQDQESPKYFLYKVFHRLSLEKEEGQELPLYQNTFWAIPSEVPFRPKRCFSKPKIQGFQTAIVTGPLGEKVFCDEQGRIKVAFPWDRRAQKDGKSSSWIRVAQNWAGPGFGGLTIPRVGMEVVVAFINGDPDFPLVTGCVYNGESLPPPYPSQNPAMSTFKTQTLGENFQGYNELRFNDAPGQEEILIHAQRDLNTFIRNDRTEYLKEGNDSKALEKGNVCVVQKGQNTLNLLKINNGNQEVEINQGNQSIVLNQGGQNTTLINGSQNTVIQQGNQSLTIQEGSQNIQLSLGNQEVSLSQGNIQTSIVQGNILTTLENGKSQTIIERGNCEVVLNQGFHKTSLARGDWDLTIHQGNQQTVIQEGKGSITIQQGNYEITLANGHLHINAQGDLSLKCSGNMTFEAGQNISFEAGMNISAQAGVNLNMSSGLSTLVEGGVDLVAKGGVRAELKGSAMCVVQGIQKKVY